MASYRRSPIGSRNPQPRPVAQAIGARNPVPQAPGTSVAGGPRLPGAATRGFVSPPTTAQRRAAFTSTPPQPPLSGPQYGGNLPAVGGQPPLQVGSGLPNMQTTAQRRAAFSSSPPQAQPPQAQPPQAQPPQAQPPQAQPPGGNPGQVPAPYPPRPYQDGGFNPDMSVARNLGQFAPNIRQTAGYAPNPDGQAPIQTGMGRFGNAAAMDQGDAMRTLVGSSRPERQQAQTDAYRQMVQEAAPNSYGAGGNSYSYGNNNARSQADAISERIARAQAIRTGEAPPRQTMDGAATLQGRRTATGRAYPTTLAAVTPQERTFQPNAGQFGRSTATVDPDTGMATVAGNMGSRELGGYGRTLAEAPDGTMRVDGGSQAARLAANRRRMQNVLAARRSGQEYNAPEPVRPGATQEQSLAALGAMQPDRERFSAALGSRGQQGQQQPGQQVAQGGNTPANTDQQREDYYDDQVNTIGQLRPELPITDVQRLARERSIERYPQAGGQAAGQSQQSNLPIMTQDTLNQFRTRDDVIAHVRSLPQDQQPDDATLRQWISYVEDRSTRGANASAASLPPAPALIPTQPNGLPDIRGLSDAELMQRSIFGPRGVQGGRPRTPSSNSNVNASSTTPWYLRRPGQ